MSVNSGGLYHIRYIINLSPQDPDALARGCSGDKKPLFLDWYVVSYLDCFSGGFLTDLPHHVKWGTESSQKQGCDV